MAKFDKTKLFIPGAILIAALFVSGAIIYSQEGLDTKSGTAVIGSGGEAQRGSGGRVDVSVDDDPFLGDKDAPVTIVEFSDYQCPFCRSFWRSALSQIKSEYIDTGKAKFVYRDFPLSFHPAAQASAEAAQCAGEEDKYWEMHDKIFQEQDKQGTGTIQYGVEDLRAWAGQIGLDSDSFNQCLDSGKFRAEVQNDFADGSSYGVSGTPTIYVNGRAVVGAQPFSAFKAIIDAELNK